jgi:hypothetical protein
MRTGLQLEQAEEAVLKSAAPDSIKVVIEPWA